MKATTARNDFLNAPAVPYPNVITRREAIHKLLDFLIKAASGIGIGAILLFILANK